MPVVEKSEKTWRLLRLPMSNRGTCRKSYKNFGLALVRTVVKSLSLISWKLINTIRVGFSFANRVVFQSALENVSWVTGSGADVVSTSRRKCGLGLLGLELILSWPMPPQARHSWHL